MHVPVFLVLIALTLVGHVVEGEVCTGTTCECQGSPVSVIDCSNRGLTEIPQFVQPFSGVLDRLDFSSNELVTFDTSELGFSFLGVRYIKLLDLSNNNLMSIPNSFAAPNLAPSYDVLNLSSNNFDTFPVKAIPEEFTRVDLLIDISNNQLTSLGNNIIAENDNFGIPTLRFIAKNNLIEKIEIMAFANAGINELYLDIRDNKLTNISQDFYFPVSQNREFYMSGNPWNCDCNLRWILNAGFKDISQVAPPNCDQPEPLKGRVLFDLRPDEFTCAPIVANESIQDLAITNGDNIITCPVTADPESSVDITWMFDLNCYGNIGPFTITAKSKIATLKDVTCFPQSNISCTGNNYAGSIDIPFNVLNDDDIGACPNTVGNGRIPGRRGGFAFLIILVVLSLFMCFVLGVYYALLLNRHVFFER